MIIHDISAKNFKNFLSGQKSNFNFQKKRKRKRKRERKRKKEKERKRDRETERQRERKKDRDRDRQRQIRETDKKTPISKQTDKNGRLPERPTHRQSDWNFRRTIGDGDKDIMVNGMGATEKHKDN